MIGTSTDGKLTSPLPPKLALARLPIRLHRAVSRFHRITRFSAVTTLRTVGNDPSVPGSLSPPIHPECANLAREAAAKLPCLNQWRLHVHFGLRMWRNKAHVCPLGLRCVCVPITFGKDLVGMAKFVAGPEVAEEQFFAAAEVLKLVVVEACQDLYASVLSEELTLMHRRVAKLQCVKRAGGSTAEESEKAAPEVASRSTPGNNAILINRILEYLENHYTESDLSLPKVARAVAANEKYVAHAFVRQTGQRMHAYMNELRVRRACDLLLHSDRQIKRIAQESGFAGMPQFRRSFRRHVGVTAGEYRRIFASAG